MSGKEGINKGFGIQTAQQEFLQTKKEEK